MPKIKMLVGVSIATGLILGAPTARAHCDSLNGPVAKAVQKALDTGKVLPVLAYAPATAEAEILTAFEKSTKVRRMGPDAQALAEEFQQRVANSLRLPRIVHPAGERLTQPEPMIGLAEQHRPAVAGQPIAPRRNLDGPLKGWLQ